MSSNGPQIQIHRLHPVPSTFALLVPSLHQPLPTPTNPWTCSCTRYICLSTFSISQTTQFPVYQSVPPTTFSPTTRLPVILPFSPPVQGPTCPSSSMPFQFNSRPARTCPSNSSSPALHQCTRSTCHILYQPSLLYP